MSVEPRKYSCKECGEPFDAYPPDDLFTYAMIEKCSICEVLELGEFVERSYECENCDAKNVVYWHVGLEHSVKQKRDCEIKLESSRFWAGSIQSEK